MKLAPWQLAQSSISGISVQMDCTAGSAEWHEWDSSATEQQHKNPGSLNTSNPKHPRQAGGDQVRHHPVTIIARRSTSSVPVLQLRACHVVTKLGTGPGLVQAGTCNTAEKSKADKKSRTRGTVAPRAGWPGMRIGPLVGLWCTR